MLYPDRCVKPRARCAHLAVACAVAEDGLEGGEKLADLLHTN